MRDLLCRLPDGKHIMDNDEFLIFIDFVKSRKTVRDVKAVYYNAAVQEEFFFVHDIEVGLPGSVALFQEFFSVGDIMDRVSGDLHDGDNPVRSINGDGDFQEQANL
jgi:hypothetical protein